MCSIETMVEALELEIETAMAIGGGDVEAASAVIISSFKELEAMISRYDALEDAVDQAQAWALDVHLGNREALQSKAAEIYALCYNARNEEATDELATS